MASISGGENQYLLWGWGRFFEELLTFMEDADRQASTANQAYSEYVLERLNSDSNCECICCAESSANYPSQ